MEAKCLNFGNEKPCHEMNVVMVLVGTETCKGMSTGNALLKSVTSAIYVYRLLHKVNFMGSWVSVI